MIQRASNIVLFCVCDVAQKGVTMLKKEVAVQLMKHLVDHDWHGYSQYSRWGDGEGTCDITIEGKVYKVEQGDRDCSSGEPYCSILQLSVGWNT